MIKKKILIIDDEPHFTQMVKMNLEETGRFEVHTLNYPRQSVAVIRQLKPDLIFLDVIMSDLDGGDVAYQIKADPEISGVPIVFLTAAVKEEEIGGGEGIIGSHTFLAKPVSVKTLIDCIDQHLQ